MSPDFHGTELSHGGEDEQIRIPMFKISSVLRLETRKLAHDDGDFCRICLYTNLYMHIRLATFCAGRGQKLRRVGVRFRMQRTLFNPTFTYVKTNTSCR